MRIVVLPFQTQNSYQANLGYELRRLGFDLVNVEGSKGWCERTLKVRPDVVHLHWLHPLILSPSWVKARIKAWHFLKGLERLQRRGVAFVWTCHNLENHSGIHIDFERRVIAMAAMRFDALVVHHVAAKAQVWNYFGINHLRDRTHTIAHAHYGDDYAGDLTRSAARQRLGLPDGEIVLMLFGQLRPNKGVERLIKVFRSLSTQRKRLRLLLVGSVANDYLARLQGVIGDDQAIEVRAGFVPDQMVQPYHAAADLAVLPYRSGLTSGALILAMSFGLPVITADCGDARRDIDPAGGVVLADAEEQTLSRAIEQLLQHEDDWIEMGRHNRAAVRLQTWRTMAEHTARVYEAVLKKEKP